MKTKISNELIRNFSPCYDPKTVVSDESEKLTVKAWVKKYRGELPDKDIVWLLCRHEFLSEKDLRLFACWCARSVKQTDEMLAVIVVAERYANGEATDRELSAADYAARSAARSAADSAADYAARSAQVDKILTYFK